MPDWFSSSLGEFTLGWFLLSVLLGGVIGAVLKFVFEIRLPESFAERRRRARLDKQFVPLLNSAVTEFEARLNRIVLGSTSEEWLQKDVFEKLHRNEGFIESYHEGVGYFALSTSYTTMKIFAMMEVIRRLSLRPEMFDIGGLVSNYDLIVRATDCFRIDSPIIGLKIKDNGTDFSILTRHIQASIGAFIIREDGHVPRIITFREFVLLYSEGDDFRKWVRCVEGYFCAIDTHTKEPNGSFVDQRVVRLTACACFLACYLDRTKRRVDLYKAKEVTHLKYLEMLALRKSLSSSLGEVKPWYQKWPF